MLKITRREYLQKRNKWIFERFRELESNGLKARRIYRQISFELDGELSPRGVQKVILKARARHSKKTVP